MKPDEYAKLGATLDIAITEKGVKPSATQIDIKNHPLAKFVDLDGTVRAPRWVIPGFVEHGVVAIAGAPGVGKTTALLPLAMTAAGLHGEDLMPHQWRHVVYVTEDVEQARRIIAGIVGHGNLGISLESVRERLHIASALRLDPKFVAQVGKVYRGRFTRVVDGVEVLPLVVLDTKSAILEMDNENDNSENSAMIAALKQGFDGLPVWLVGHVAKQSIGRSDVAQLSNRGGGSIDGDSNLTMFLIVENDVRYLALGKHRFEPRWKELEIVSHTAQVNAQDEFGRAESVVLRWGIAAPPDVSRKEAFKQAAERERKEEASKLRQEVRDAIDTAWRTGNPLNRAGVKDHVKRKAADVVTTVNVLLDERWLYEVLIPRDERPHPRKESFLISLTTQEHENLLAGIPLSQDRVKVPASWKKLPISIVPELGNGCPANEGESHAR